MGLFSKARDFVFGKPQNTRPVEIPGIIDRPEAAGYLRQATGMTGQPSRYQGLLDTAMNGPRAANPYAQKLQSSILNPTFGPSNPAEKAYIDAIYSGRQGQFNSLGVGASPGTQTAVAAAAAPSLLDFYQRNIGNMQTAQDAWNTNENTIGKNQMDGLLGALEAELKTRGLDLDVLLKAAEMGRPQVGSETKGARKGLYDYMRETNSDAVDTFSKLLPIGGGKSTVKG